MKARSALTLAVSALALLSGAGAPGPQWEELLRRSDLRVYQAHVPGSRVYALRAEGAVDQPLPRVAWALLDVERSSQWIDRLHEDRVLRTLGPLDYEEFSWVRMPHLVHDRDLVTRVHVEVAPDGRSLTITSRSVDDPAVPSPHRVRAQLDYQQIRLQALPGARTWMEIEVHIDPKGSLPAWLINYFQRRWPPLTFDALRRQAARSDLRPPPRLAGPLSALRP